FESGPPRCDKIDPAEIRQRITDLGFTSESKAEDNVPVDDQTLELLAQSLNAAFKRNSGAPPKIANDGGQCPDSTSTPPASYCPNANTVSIDQTKLDQLAALPPNDQLGVGASELGDFAAFAEIASRYVLGVQKSLGIAMNDPNAGLRTACLTGAWAGVARHRVAGGPAE